MPSLFRRFLGSRLFLKLTGASLLLGGLATLYFLNGQPGPSQAPGGADKPRPPAPELDGGVAWLNTAAPIKLADLRGRIVLLDFWTLCCINCIHTLPDLAKLEAKYPGILVVLGIHTPKFPHEKLTESVRKAVLRYQISHPVINDAEAILWRRYRVRSWPTLVLIDPDGRYYGEISGEGAYELLDRHIGLLAREYRAKNQLKEQPLHFQLARTAESGASPLYFPGKVLADQASNRLFIADSTHHRIVITTLEGQKIAIAGTGVEGKADGTFATARFSDPQGMALQGEMLYVADRKNHLIRALDLKNQTVRVIAGTGVQNRERTQAGPALEVGLNSPWDLLLHDNKLYIAMAGHHQIWRLDLASSRLDPFAGKGAEDLRDGPLSRALFAQPSGLASDGKTLYVADSEISAIRALPLSGDGEVSTIVGEGLFEFGDVDGEGSKVRLQHALGVACHQGKLYVADTYNCKIKEIDPATRTCTTFMGQPGGWLGDALFNEPGGLSFAGDRLYVADTSAHRIRVVDLRTRGSPRYACKGCKRRRPPSRLRLRARRMWAKTSARSASANPQAANTGGKSMKTAAPVLWAAGAVLALALGARVAAASIDPFDPANQAKSPAKTSLVDPFAPANQAVPRKAETAISRQLTQLIDFKMKAVPSEARPGRLIKVTVTGHLKKGFHTYPVTKKTLGQLDGQLTQMEFVDNPAFTPLWPINESEPVFRKEADGNVYLEHDEEFTLSQDVFVSPQAGQGAHTLALRIHLMVCAQGCIGPADYPLLQTQVDVTGPAVPVSEDMQKLLLAKKPAIAVIAPPAALIASGQGEAAAPPKTAPAVADQMGLGGLLVSACLGAFLMLLTPCVFPMIPITVNFFLKQSEKEHHNALAMASVYAGTIIFMLALVMIVLGRQVIQWASSPWFNLFLGGVLIIFALSLFGMYEIELPSGLARFTSAREGQGGYLGTVFMALTFTITSFTCTGPFLGALLGGVAAIRPPFGHLVLAALVYSATFAAPFFVLAFFPTLLRKLPKSGGWLNAVKVAMGFLEIGAALKFLANTDLYWNPGNPRFFSYDAVLCAWIALSFACGLYLIGAFRLPHDDPAEHIGAVRMMFATFFFGLAVYMTPALRRETPQGILGEGLVAFLPPSFDSPSAKGGPGAGPQLAWYQNYETAWEAAKRDNKLIFIDFTGQTCTNCRANEKNVFARSPVHELLNKYVLVQLYTDTVPDRSLTPQQAREQGERNTDWQLAIGDLTLPSYTILAPARDAPLEKGMPKGQVLGRRNGLIQDVQDFVRFLEEPQQQVARQSTAQASARLLSEQAIP